MTRSLSKVGISWLIVVISFVVICSIYTFSRFMAGSTVQNVETSAPHEKAVVDLPIKELTAPDPQENPVNAEVVLPQFDVVRIAKDGSAVLAGRASPGAKVTVSNSRQVIGIVTANRQGEWVLVPKLPLTPGDTELRVESEQDGRAKVTADHVVVLKVPERDSKVQPLVVLLPRKPHGTARILQNHTPDFAFQKGKLIFKSVDYDDQGNTIMAGMGEIGHVIKIYADNQNLGEGKVNNAGEWIVQLKDKLSPGAHNLRVDQCYGNDVKMRIEVPFVKVEKPHKNKTKEFVIVQPGNSLWRIARRELGGGTRYTIIYKANKQKVLDPNLIYPGQILEIPKVN